MALEKPVEISGLVDRSIPICGKRIGTKRYRHPKSGKEYEYAFFYGEHRWGIMVIPFTTQGEIIVVQQFRHGINDLVYEFPGGSPNHPLEDPAEVAVRELREETGYTSTDLVPLANTLCIDAANYLGKIHPFVAYGCQLTHRPELDAGEHAIEYIEVHCFPFPHWLDLIDQGKVNDAKTLAMTFLWMRREQRT